MIHSAEEFIQLRQSPDLNEQARATHEPAEMEVWLDVIQTFPDFKIWVIRNKTIQLEILELLAQDKDPRVRCEVAGKRKINAYIFLLLSVDKDVNVRYSLMCNTKLTPDQKRVIKRDDSSWLTKQFEDIVKRDGNR